MPVQAIAPPVPDEPLSGWSWAHPLAQIAARHCRAHAVRPRRLVGGVACAGCWETAIRDDEQFRLEAGLPRRLDRDPTYIDHIAVQQAIAGRRVPLTRAERAEVRQRLAEIRIRRNRQFGFRCPARAGVGR